MGKAGSGMVKAGPGRAGQGMGEIDEQRARTGNDVVDGARTGAGIGLRMTAGGENGSDGGVGRLFAALRGGQTRALARAVSLVEDGTHEGRQVLELCRRALDARASEGGVRAYRIGITGPAGAGKSTLVDALARVFRSEGRRVAIVAVDPSSAYSGGAILGDRIRLSDLAGDSGVYMRSMATRGHPGGLAEATEDVLTVIEAAWSEPTGDEVLLVETTGVGQGEIAVVGLADAVALVLVPGMGDSVQSLKAGVLEIASAYVLNKADHEGIDRLETEIEELVGLGEVVRGRNAESGEPGRDVDGLPALGRLRPGLDRPGIIRTVATTGEGVADLVKRLDELKSNSGSRRRAPWPGTGAKRSQVPDLPRGLSLDHLGVAVRSIADSLGLYSALGVEAEAIESVPQERVRVAMLSLGGSRMELLEASDNESTIARFIARRGEGLHHVALRVADLERSVADLRASGIRLVSESIRVGAGGHRYVFIHPSSANGVLLELVEGGAAHPAPAGLSKAAADEDTNC